MLHQFIAEGNTSKLKETLKQDPTLVNQPNEQGLTPLQFACRLGLSGYVLYLVEAGAEIDLCAEVKADNRNISEDARKTPLYLAAERGHLGTAQNLLACGANKHVAVLQAQEFQQPEIEKFLLQKIKLTNTVMSRILYWHIRTFDPTYGNSLFDKIEKRIKFLMMASSGDLDAKNESQISCPLKKDLQNHSEMQENIFGFIELAAKFQCRELLIKLIELNKGKLRQNVECLTAGYWVLTTLDPVTDAAIYSLVYSNRDDRAVTLAQLYPSEKYHQLTKDFTEEEDNRVTQKIQELRRKNLDEFKSPRAMLLYEEAARGSKSDKFVKLAENIEDYYESFTHALRRKNWVALDALDLARKDGASLLPHLLKHNQHDLARIWMTINNVSVYQAALHIRRDIPNLKSFIEHHWSEIGLLYTIFANSVLKPLPVTELHELIEPFAKHPMIPKILFRCIQDHYDLSSVQLVEENGGFKIVGQCSAFLQSSLIAIFNRFNIANRFHIEFDFHHSSSIQQIFGFLPKELWELTLEYFNAEEHEKFEKEMGQLGYDILQRAKQNRVWQLGNRVQQLEQQFVLMNQFLAAVQREGNDKFCCVMEVTDRCGFRTNTVNLLLLIAFATHVTFITSGLVDNSYSNGSFPVLIILFVSLGFYSLLNTPGICQSHSKYHTGTDRSDYLPISNFSPQITQTVITLLNEFSPEENPLSSIPLSDLWKKNMGWMVKRMKDKREEISEEMVDLKAERSILLQDRNEKPSVSSLASDSIANETNQTKTSSLSVVAAKKIIASPKTTIRFFGPPSHALLSLDELAESKTPYQLLEEKDNHQQVSKLVNDDSYHLLANDEEHAVPEVVISVDAGEISEDESELSEKDPMKEPSPISPKAARRI